MGRGTQIALVLALNGVMIAMSHGQESREAEALALWKLDGSLDDALAGRMLEPQGAGAEWVEGPQGGQAARFTQEGCAVLTDASSLEASFTTVEVMFKAYEASYDYNPALVAMRDAEQRTRFSIHLSRDLSQVAIWTGSSVVWTRLPEQALAPDRWHYLAVTSGRDGLRVYVDGARCVLEGHGGFNTAQSGLPLVIAAANPAGYESIDAAFAHVAIHSGALAEAAIAQRADEAGLKERRLALTAQQQAQREQLAAQAAARAERRRGAISQRLEDRRLFDQGTARVYEKEALDAVSLPLGGIGAGCVQMNGRGRLHIWQIFDHYAPVALPDSFFAVSARAEGETPVIRMLQAEGPEILPVMQGVAFRGEYPFGWYDFEDGELPVSVSAEAFSPLLPLNARDSAIPCAIFNLTARNGADRPVEVSFLGAMQNAVGYPGAGEITKRRFKTYGGNTNRVRQEDFGAALHMAAVEQTGENRSDMALAASGGAVSGRAAWETGADLLADLADDNRLSGADASGPTQEGVTANGALCVTKTLAPGESWTAPFVLTWYFPEAKLGRWLGEGRRYTAWWSDALSVAREVMARLEELTAATRRYHGALYATNLPHWLLDRMANQVAILRTPTCYWGRDGYFGGWEGCCPEVGCCAGNCTHVWHYAQAHARLFPSIARRMREQSLHWQADSGAIPMRQPQSFAAADGQCGEILGAYREHLMTPDRDWLDAHWPSIRLAMEYMIQEWDADEDGVLSGPQHNTLDGELGGSTSWIGTLYLAALAASGEMARLEGEPKLAERYHAIRTAGAARQNATLWNGSYYVQIPGAEPQQDYNTGCHIDQLLGEWWADQLDLPAFYPEARKAEALETLFWTNFQPDFEGIHQAPRQFVAEEDAGMQMIVWPGGNRPNPSILYGDEVMTGFEYAAAAAMIQHGLMREGLTVVRAIADRYDGRLRTGLTAAPTASWGYSGNPFGDDECGKFYARAMSSWSLLLACQGYIYDGPAGRIGFLPRWLPEEHASFFTAAEGYGVYEQRRRRASQEMRVNLVEGRLRAHEFVFALPAGVVAAQVEAHAGDRLAPAKLVAGEGRYALRFQEPVDLPAGETLTVTASW